MALSGALLADFSSFTDACAKAVSSLKDIEGDSSKVETSLNRVSDSLSGVKIVQQATLAAEAVDRIGGVSKLTEAELQRVGAIATEAAAKLVAMGQSVPPGIQNIADRARGAAEETLRLGATATGAGDRFKDWTGKFDIQKAITDPTGTAKAGMSAFAETLGPTGIALGLVATAGAAAGAALFKLTSDAAAVGGALDDMADKTGLSVPALSRLSNASQVIGADMGSLTDVVFKLQRGIGDNTAEFQGGLAKMSLSTNDLKAAGPDRYLELVTEGLKGIADPSERAAAGQAVLGRGYKDVAAALNDLDAGFKATADLSPWTAEQAARAEKFEQQIASIETHTKAAAIAVGDSLIPAISFLITTAEDGVTVLGDFSGATAAIQGVASAYGWLTGVLGQNALAEQVAGVQADEVTKLWSAQGATSETVATQMLALGRSQEQITDATGLSAAQIKVLAGELQGTKTAAEAYGDAWVRANAALAIGPPTIDTVSASTRGLVADMRAANVSIETIATATELSVPQIQLLGAAQDAAAASAKKLADELQKTADDAMKNFSIAWSDLARMGGSAQDAVAAMDGELVKTVKYYLDAGASVATLAKAFPQLGDVGVTQIQRVNDASKGLAKSLADWAGFTQRVEDSTLSLQARINSIDGAVVEEATHMIALGASAADVQKYFALTDAQIKAIVETMRAAGTTAGTLGHAIVTSSADASRAVHTLAGEYISLAEAQKRHDAGNATTIDLSTQPGRDAVDPAIATWLRDGYSLAQASAIAYDLAARIPINPNDPLFTTKGPRVPGFAEGGTIMVGERGPEVVRLPLGSTVFPTGMSPSADGAAPVVHVAAGAVVLNYPIMRDRQAMDQLGSIAGDAIVKRLVDGGWRPPRLG